MKFYHYGGIDVLHVVEVARPVPGKNEVLVAKVYALADVRDAYRELEQRHTHGKIVLVP